MLQLDLLIHLMNLENDDEHYFDFRHFQPIEVRVFDVNHDFLVLN